MGLYGVYGFDVGEVRSLARALDVKTGPRPAEDKLSYPVGRIIILSEDSPDIG